MNYRQSLRALFEAVLWESEFDKSGKLKAELAKMKKEDNERFLKSIEKEVAKLEYQKKHGKPMPVDRRENEYK